MLITRISPALAKITQAQIRYASSQSVFLQSAAGINKMSTSPIARQPNSLSGSTCLLKSSNLTVCKAYSTKQPELPSKQELEKYFFKVTVVIWDLAWKITFWAWGMLRKYIIDNPTVQSYWRTFNHKLEQARKN